MGFAFMATGVRPALLCAMGLALLSGACRRSGDESNREPDVQRPRIRTLNGPVVFDTRGAAALDRKFPLHFGEQFSAFRNEDEPQSVQFVSLGLAPVALPSGQTSSFLCICYSLGAPRSYNGVWFKMGHADWTPYAKGDLVLRLRRFPPLQRVAGPDGHGAPIADTECTTVFKVELTTREQSGTPVTAGLLQALTQTESRMQAANGYFDWRIPLRDFNQVRNLSRVSTVVIVFEYRNVPEAYRRGTLGLQAMVLTRDSAEPVDDILNSHGWWPPQREASVVPRVLVPTALVGRGPTGGRHSGAPRPCSPGSGPDGGGNTQ
jgi:hypothetical protein